MFVQNSRDVAILPPLVRIRCVTPGGGEIVIRAVIIVSIRRQVGTIVSRIVGRIRVPSLTSPAAFGQRCANAALFVVVANFAIETD